MLTWLCHITKPFLGITKGPQGDFKPKHATPQDKAGYVHLLMVEFSTGRKFLRSRVLFTQNHDNPTKIWTSSCSKIRTLNSRSNFLLLRSKILNGKVWTPWPAKLFYSKSVAAWLLSWEENKKAGVRVMLLLERFAWKHYRDISVRQFRANPTKYRTVPCEHKGDSYPVAL